MLHRCVSFVGYDQARQPKAAGENILQLVAFVMSRCTLHFLSARFP